MAKYPYATSFYEFHGKADDMEVVAVDYDRLDPFLQGFLKAHANRMEAAPEPEWQEGEWVGAPPEPPKLLKIMESMSGKAKTAAEMYGMWSEMASRKSTEGSADRILWDAASSLAKIGEHAVEPASIVASLPVLAKTWPIWLSGLVHSTVQYGEYESQVSRYQEAEPKIARSTWRALSAIPKAFLVSGTEQLRAEGAAQLMKLEGASDEEIAKRRQEADKKAIFHSPFGELAGLGILAFGGYRGAKAIQRRIRQPKVHVGGTEFLFRPRAGAPGEAETALRVATPQGRAIFRFRRGAPVGLPPKGAMTFEKWAGIPVAEEIKPYQIPWEGPTLPGITTPVRPGVRAIDILMRSGAVRAGSTPQQAAQQMASHFQNLWKAAPPVLQSHIAAVSQYTKDSLVGRPVPKPPEDAKLIVLGNEPKAQEVLPKAPASSGAPALRAGLAKAHNQQIVEPSETAEAIQKDASDLLEGSALKPWLNYTVFQGGVSNNTEIDWGVFEDKVAPVSRTTLRRPVTSEKLKHELAHTAWNVREHISPKLLRQFEKSVEVFLGVQSDHPMVKKLQLNLPETYPAQELLARVAQGVDAQGVGPITGKMLRLANDILTPPASTAEVYPEQPIAQEPPGGPVVAAEGVDPTPPPVSAPEPSTAQLKVEQARYDVRRLSMHAARTAKDVRRQLHKAMTTPEEFGHYLQDLGMDDAETLMALEPEQLEEVKMGWLSEEPGFILEPEEQMVQGWNATGSKRRISNAAHLFELLEDRLSYLGAANKMSSKLSEAKDTATAPRTRAEVIRSAEASERAKTVSSYRARLADYENSVATVKSQREDLENEFRNMEAEFVDASATDKPRLDEAMASVINQHTRLDAILDKLTNEYPQSPAKIVGDGLQLLKDKGFDISRQLGAQGTTGVYGILGQSKRIGNNIYVDANDAAMYLDQGRLEDFRDYLLGVPHTVESVLASNPLTSFERVNSIHVVPGRTWAYEGYAEDSGSKIVTVPVRELETVTNPAQFATTLTKRLAEEIADPVFQLDPEVAQLGASIGMPLIEIIGLDFALKYPIAVEATAAPEISNLGPSGFFSHAEDQGLVQGFRHYTVGDQNVFVANPLASEIEQRHPILEKWQAMRTDRPYKILWGVGDGVIATDREAHVSAANARDVVAIAEQVEQPITSIEMGEDGSFVKVNGPVGPMAYLETMSRSVPNLRVSKYEPLTMLEASMAGAFAKACDAASDAKTSALVYMDRLAQEAHEVWIKSHGNDEGFVDALQNGLRRASRQMSSQKFETRAVGYQAGTPENLKLGKTQARLDIEGDRSWLKTGGNLYIRDDGKLPNATQKAISRTAGDSLLDAIEEYDTSTAVDTIAKPGRVDNVILRGPRYVALARKAALDKATALLREAGNESPLGYYPTATGDVVIVAGEAIVGLVPGTAKSAKYSYILDKMSDNASAVRNAPVLEQRAQQQVFDFSKWPNKELVSKIQGITRWAEKQALTGEAFRRALQPLRDGLSVDEYAEFVNDMVPSMMNIRRYFSSPVDVPYWWRQYLEKFSGKRYFRKNRPYFDKAGNFVASPEQWRKIHRVAWHAAKTTNLPQLNEFVAELDSRGLGPDYTDVHQRAEFIGDQWRGRPHHEDEYFQSYSGSYKPHELKLMPEPGDKMLHLDDVDVTTPAPGVEPVPKIKFAKTPQDKQLYDATLAIGQLKKIAKIGGIEEAKIIGKAVDPSGGPTLEFPMKRAPDVAREMAAHVNARFGWFAKYFTHELNKAFKEFEPVFADSMEFIDRKAGLFRQRMFELEDELAERLGVLARKGTRKYEQSKRKIERACHKDNIPLNSDERAVIETWDKYLAIREHELLNFGEYLEGVEKRRAGNGTQMLLDSQLTLDDVRAAVKGTAGMRMSHWLPSVHSLHPELDTFKMADKIGILGWLSRKFRESDFAKYIFGPDNVMERRYAKVNPLRKATGQRGPEPGDPGYTPDLIGRMEIGLANGLYLNDLVRGTEIRQFAKDRGLYDPTGMKRYVPKNVTAWIDIISHPIGHGSKGLKALTKAVGILGAPVHVMYRALLSTWAVIIVNLTQPTTGIAEYGLKAGVKGWAWAIKELAKGSGKLVFGKETRSALDEMIDKVTGVGMLWTQGPRAQQPLRQPGRLPQLLRRVLYPVGLAARAVADVLGFTSFGQSERINLAVAAKQAEMYWDKRPSMLAERASNLGLPPEETKLVLMKQAMTRLQQKPGEFFRYTPWVLSALRGMVAFVRFPWLTADLFFNQWLRQGRAKEAGTFLATEAAMAYGLHKMGINYRYSMLHGKVGPVEGGAYQMLAPQVKGVAELGGAMGRIAIDWTRGLPTSPRDRYKMVKSAIDLLSYRLPASRGIRRMAEGFTGVDGQKLLVEILDNALAQEPLETRAIIKKMKFLMDQPGKRGRGDQMQVWRDLSERLRKALGFPTVAEHEYRESVLTWQKQADMKRFQREQIQTSILAAAQASSEMDTELMVEYLDETVARAKKLWGPAYKKRLKSVVKDMPDRMTPYMVGRFIRMSAETMVATYQNEQTRPYFMRLRKLLRPAAVDLLERDWGTAEERALLRVAFDIK